MYLQLLLWIVTIYCFHLGHLSILSKYYKRMMQVVTFPPLLPNVASYFHLKPPLACYYYLVLLCFAWFLLSSFCICCAANAVSIFVSSSFTSTLKTYTKFFLCFLDQVNFARWLDEEWKWGRNMNFQTFIPVKHVQYIYYLNKKVHFNNS